MSRSHPPALLKLVERSLRRECEVRRGATLVLAVSGGSDSMALLHTCALLRPRLSLRLVAVGVDHSLREAARSELQLAASLARKLGVEWLTRTVCVAAGGNLQARARDARYAALESVCEELGDTALLATAHHAQDRAETVLIRLLRGTCPQGLAVLPARAGCRIRPMIRARKDAIYRHLERHSVPFARDPSNRDARFLRVRVRHELLPLLQELSPGILGHLNALADESAEVPLPPIFDASGTPVRLNRAQRAQLRQAIRHRNPACSVLLPKGRCVVIDSKSGTPRLRQDAEPTESALQSQQTGTTRTKPEKFG